MTNTDNQKPDGSVDGKSLGRRTFSRLVSSQLYLRLGFLSKVYFIWHSFRHPTDINEILDKETSLNGSLSEDINTHLQSMRNDADRRIDLIWRSVQIVATLITLLVLFIGYSLYRSTDEFNTEMLRQKDSVNSTVQEFENSIASLKQSLSNDTIKIVREELSKSKIQNIMQVEVANNFRKFVQLEITNQLADIYYVLRSNEVLAVTNVVKEAFIYGDTNRFILARMNGGAIGLIFRLKSEPKGSSISVWVDNMQLSSLKTITAGNVLFIAVSDISHDFIEAEWQIRYEENNNPSMPLCDLNILSNGTINLRSAFGNHFTFPNMNYYEYEEVK